MKFIDEMKDKFDIRMLCKAIDLHHSVYYYHKKSKINSYVESNKELDKKILDEFEKSKNRYGSPKITKILNNQGIKVSQKRVARRMKILGIRSIIVKNIIITVIKKLMIQTKKICLHKISKQKNQVKNGLEI